jgi:hypothetical protein
VQVKDHVLLPEAADLEAVDVEFCKFLSAEIISPIVSLIPDEWLAGEQQLESAESQRQVYVEFLLARLDASQILVEEAQHARKTFV